MSGGADPTQHLWWLSSRALGIVAMALVSLSVGLGLAMSSRLGRKPGLPARMRNAHEALALSGLVAIAGHGLLLLGDSYLRPGLAGITLPFAMANQPLWTGLGIIGGWLAAIVGLSFYVRRWIGTPVWRWLHRWTLAVYVLGLAHALGSGTDAGSTWFLLILVATAAPIVFAGAYRLLPDERSTGRPGRPPTRQLSPSRAPSGH
jgi:sulfoxide reductase heme-binding subunit YedZ